MTASISERGWNSRQRGMVASVWLVSMVLLSLLAYIGPPLAIVSAGQRGVLTTMGKPSDEVYAEVVHFILPFVQRMNTMDVH
ncbi:MAG: hypothetical protein HXX19_07995, partial [Rhodoferax sp.]|nr:hypothetical protein [Rhodoferax sp.]